MELRPPALAAVTLVVLGLIWPVHADIRPIMEGGCIIVPPREGQAERVCPLEHTDVAVDIAGFIARVTVTQRFSNPFPDPIEAVYTFPLSSRAAVDSMRIEIGDRTIVGRIKRRAEAREIYDRARAAGQTASLLDQERPNIFTQSLANILPGEAIVVVISYIEYLEYEEGAYHFDFPMTIGPRYLPASVPDAERIAARVTSPDTRAGHDIALTLLLDAGVSLKELSSEQHEIEVERIGDTKAVVRLANRREIPNRDFILRYRTAGEGIQEAVMTHRRDGDGYFTLLINPPARPAESIVTPRELVFVIDCSGSMSGFPIEKAKAAMRRCIESMHPRDRFNLISFAGGTGYCFKRPVENTREHRERALNYLAQLQGGGGTEMMGAVRAALAGPYDEDYLRVVCFMTDAFIGNDMEILAEIQKSAHRARVFAFGIGSSVNRFLIEGMAREGRGAAEIVTLESDSDAAVQRFYERVRQPVLTDIALDFQGVSVEDVLPSPARVPDLFAAQPVMVTGRYTHPGKGEVMLRGKTPTGAYERRIVVDFPESAPDHAVLAPLWARQKIDAIMAEDWRAVHAGNADGAHAEAIARLGLEYSLMTQYTSFVAVEERTVNENGSLRRIEVPVELPDGVSYEGIYGERDAAKGSALGFPSVGPGVMGTQSFRSRSIGLSAPMTSLVPNSKNDTAAGGLRERGETMKSSHTEDTVSADAASSSVSARDRIDSALHGLLGGAKDGVYAEGKVRVQHGKLAVFVRLNAINDVILDALRAAGAEIISLRAAQQGVLIRIKVEALETLAAVDGVLRVELPQV